MGDIRNVSKSGKARNRRIIKLAPMTRAVRSALAVSALTLGIGLTGNVSAANHRLPATMVHALQTERPTIDFAPVFDLTVVQDVAPLAFAPPVMPTLIGVGSHLPGDVVIDNYSAGTKYVPSGSEEVIGISGYSDGGNVTITNHAGANKYAETAGDGNAIGIYGYALVGDTTINNDANLGATSAYGLADGIFASGANVGVTNAGNITANGYNWAIGIEAQGSNATDVSNSGDISVSALPFMQIEDDDGIVASTDGYQAFGIYVTAGSGGAAVGNTGNVQVEGGDATGLYVLSEGDVAVGNGGNIYAGSGLHSHSGQTYDYYYGTGNAVGINASSSGVDAAVGIDNDGTIIASGIESGIGITGAASAEGGTISVVNDGTVIGASYFGSAEGITVSGYAGASIESNGDVVAFAQYYGTANGLTALSFAGDTSVTNTGDVLVNAYYTAYGVVSYAGLGFASAINDGGQIEADSANTGIGMDISGYTGASVTNSGDILVDAWKGYGIRANAGGGDVDVTNTGSIYATYGGPFNSRAFGIYGKSVNGDVGIVNDGGDIATHMNDLSVGIFGLSDNADVNTTNGGSIYAYSANALAVGVYVSGDMGTASVNNTGSIEAYSYNDEAFGVLARGDAVKVGNSGDVSANGLFKAEGIVANSNNGDALVASSSGSIEVNAVGAGIGIDAQSMNGNAKVANAGGISVMGTVNEARGVQAISGAGSAIIDNGGSIYAGSEYGDATGIYGYSIAGDVGIGNSGEVSATGYYLATGVIARSYVGTLVNMAASSQISAESGFIAIGIEGRAEAGNVTVGNAGGIATAGAYGSVGIQAYSAMGDVTVGNTGHIDAASEYGIAIGATGLTMAGDVEMSNGGLIEAAGSIGSYGILAQTYAGNVVVNNASNGRVEAAGGLEAIGVLVSSADGDSTVNNAGVIHAGDAYYATGVVFEGMLGSNTLNNLATGLISADGDEGYAFAVAGTDAVETINNSGRILGAVMLYGDDDVFSNKAGGTWDVGSTLSTDFGDGNDTLANAAGGTITLDEGQIAFGAGDDTVNNAGRINLTNSTITMGDNQPAPLLVQAFLPQAVEINAFNNSGTLKVVGDSAVDTAGGIFTNTGVIDFGNGVTTDALTLDGTLAGTGNIAVDVDFDDHSADQLLINGNVASSAVQTVNVRFTGVPTLSTMETKVDIVNVTGTSVASNFVAGQVVGYNWNGNFLSLGAGIVSTLDATNATDDLFSVGITVEGLSDGGALAATAASGAAGFLNSQVGTFRQRLGVNPYGDAGKVMSAFVRFYSDQGDVNPTHAASNFGQGGNFAYEQTSWGREFGINANLFGNFHAGVVLGNADSRQRLTDGVGENRMNGTSFGAYATWYVPEGLYVDLSGRWMGADIRSNSTGANLQSRTRTSAVSLEAGYEWKLGGVNVVPQAQYIRTRVEDVRTFYGENLDFTVQGGTFERGRVGVEVNKTFQLGDIRWTPYGSISAIRDTGGKTAYTVGDFYGATGVSGSRTMAELGLGVQKGGLGLTLGLNWLDGGALKSFVGGQANVRYSW
jgi:outer membrane autotransporter protein